MNKVILVGRIGHTPEGKELTGGGRIATFNVATNRPFKNKETGEYDTDWHRCTAFGQPAEFILNYLKKGSLVCIDGRVEYSSYENKDGVKMHSTKIMVNTIENHSSKKEADADPFDKIPVNNDPDDIDDSDF